MRGTAFAFIWMMVSASAFASPASFNNQDKEGLARAMNGGIVYPSLYGAIQTNPAGLIHDHKTVLQIEWDPPSNYSPSGLLAQGVAFGNNVFGFGAKLAANTQGNLLALNHATIAGAVGVTGFAFGMNGTFDWVNGTGLDVDAGLSVQNMSGIQISILLTSVQNFRAIGALNFGLGISKP